MASFDNLQQFCSRLSASLKSSVKMLLQSRPTTPYPKPEGDTLIVLGNGPSLKKNIQDDSAVLRRFPTMAVNFALNTPEIRQLQPRYYVLADPLFFSSQPPLNVAELIQNINAVAWPMTLFIPVQSQVSSNMFYNPNVQICTFNMIGAQGFEGFEAVAFSKGWAMPRPRNVLIPSLMVALWMGYKNIYILGADHGWTKTLTVTDDNRVASVQPHFYADDQRELDRQHLDYINMPLHKLLQSFSIAFASYHVIQRYATEHQQRILNATPGSFIDAFERASLPSAN